MPEWASSQADDAAFFASAYGLTPDPWQLRVLSAWLGEAQSGRWAVSRAGLAVPRQNGKNACLEVRELYGMVALGERFLHTAHEVKTARKAFIRLASFFENVRAWPELAELVKELRRTNGQEAILLHNGGSVEFVARSRGSGRGYTVDVLVCDEAQELTDEQQEALLSTTSAAPTGNPQLLLTGTPPPPGTTAEVFARMRADGHEANDPRLAWHEWSVGDDPDLDDRELWAAANPALGGRLNVEVVETERAQLTDDGFARERLGSWERNAAGSVIDPDVWMGSKDPASKITGTKAFAVDVPPEGGSAVVGVGGFRSDGRPHVEVVEQRSGTRWVYDPDVRKGLVQLAKRHPDAPLVLDPASRAGGILAPLQQALKDAGCKNEVLLVSGRELAAACSRFMDELSEGNLRHLGQPLLTVAADAARKRNVGSDGGWAWHRRDTASDISPLVSVTLALHGAGKPSKKRVRTGKAAFV